MAGQRRLILAAMFALAACGPTAEECATTNAAMRRCIEAAAPGQASCKQPAGKCEAEPATIAAVDAYRRRSQAFASESTAQQAVKTFGPEKVESAKSIMAMAAADARIFEEGETLVVEMRSSIPDPGERLRYFTAIADADAILANGKARIIHFYGPGNARIGQADPLRGIRLVD